MNNKRTYRVVFAHGLEGSPAGYKATYLRERFQAVAPDLRVLGLAGQSAALIEAMGNETTVLVGSSLGALSAWGAAIRRPELVKHLVLLAPAMGCERFALDYPEVEQQRPGLFAEVASYWDRSVPSGTPCTIIHGMEDEIIATSDVVALAERSPSARLLLVHDDHSLVDAQELICQVVERVQASRVRRFGPNRLGTPV